MKKLAATDHPEPEFKSLKSLEEFPKLEPKLVKVELFRSSIHMHFIGKDQSYWVMAITHFDEKSGTGICLESYSLLWSGTTYWLKPAFRREKGGEK